MDFAFWQTKAATGVIIESSRPGAASPSTMLVNPVFIAGVPEDIFQRLFRNGIKVEGTEYAFRPEWPSEILRSFTFDSNTIQWSDLEE